ncbi:MAG: hypothetical protein JWM53_5389, partial [bacterium]|nr:hypothetical protein [bacterium]
MDEQKRFERPVATPATRRPAGDGTPGHLNHVVQFYEDDAFLCDTVGRFIGAGLAAGENVVIIATDLHRHAFVQRLKANDFDVERALANGRLTLLDARETMQQLLIDNMPDWDRVCDVIGAVLGAAAAGVANVRVYGEMVDLLWRDGNPDAAIRLEQMWNDLGRLHKFSLLCAYVMGNFSQESDSTAFERICHAHAHVMPAESYSKLEDPDDRLREVSLLQQRARALEAEIEQRKAVEARLARLIATETNRNDDSEERFRLIVESVNDYAIFMLDCEGRVTSWNAGAERIKGYRADEIIGQHFSRFYPDEEVRGGTCVHELRVAARDGRFEDEGWRLRKDGSRFWANVIISRIVDRRDGRLVGFAKVTRDLTQRRALELEKIARAGAEAELAERNRTASMRERLLGVVGHDLRSPLSAISMAASVLLKRGTLEGGDAKMAARIARNADRMAKMISQLLDVTRARLGGGIPIDPKPIDFAEVCREVVDDIEIANSERKFTLARTGDGKGVWDRERLAQVVANLVGNSVQYGKPEAPIAVGLDGTGAAIILTVHNDGEPIPADVLPVIFDPF